MYEKSSVRRRIGGLILAAGLSSRMGDFKPLMPLRGKTLIENTIDSLLLCGIHFRDRGSGIPGTGGGAGSPQPLFRRHSNGCL